MPHTRGGAAPAGTTSRSTWSDVHAPAAKAGTTVDRSGTAASSPREPPPRPLHKPITAGLPATPTMQVHAQDYVSGETRCGHVQSGSPEVSRPRVNSGERPRIRATACRSGRGGGWIRPRSSGPSEAVAADQSSRALRRWPRSMARCRLYPTRSQQDRRSYTTYTVVLKSGGCSHAPQSP